MSARPLQSVDLHQDRFHARTSIRNTWCRVSLVSTHSSKHYDKLSLLTKLSESKNSYWIVRDETRHQQQLFAPPNDVINPCRKDSVMMQVFQVNDMMVDNSSYSSASLREPPRIFSFERRYAFRRTPRGQIAVVPTASVGALAAIHFSEMTLTVDLFRPWCVLTLATVR